MQLAEVEVDVGGVDDRLRGGRRGVNVVAVEGDVEVADRQLGPGQLAEEGVEAAGEERAAGVDADQGEIPGIGVLLGDLVGDPPQRSPQIVVLEHDLLTHSSLLPSWPHGTGLKDARRVAARVAGPVWPRPHELRGGSAGGGSGTASPSRTAGGSVEAVPEPPRSRAPFGTSSG